MDSFQNLVLQQPAQQRRSANAKRHGRERDGKGSTARELSLRILRERVVHV